MWQIAPRVWPHVLYFTNEFVGFTFLNILGSKTETNKEPGVECGANMRQAAKTSLTQGTKRLQLEQPFLRSKPNTPQCHKKKLVRIIFKILKKQNFLLKLRYQCHSTSHA